MEAGAEAAVARVEATAHVVRVAASSIVVEDDAPNDSNIIECLHEISLSWSCFSI